MTWRGKPAHIYADLSHQQFGCHCADAWHGGHQSRPLPKGLQSMTGLRLQLHDGGIQRIDVAQVHFEHEAVVTRMFLRNASSNSAGVTFARVVTQARSCSGDVYPLMTARSTARPILPLISLVTLIILILASFSNFSIRCMWEARLRMNCLRFLGKRSQFLYGRLRYEACADETVGEQSASHIESFMSDLRPGTFLTRAALAG